MDDGSRPPTAPRCLRHGMEDQCGPWETSAGPLGRRGTDPISESEVMLVEESDGCARQRTGQEGWSLRGGVSKGGGASPAAGGRLEIPKRARRRKLDTAKVDLEPPTELRRTGRPP